MLAWLIVLGYLLGSVPTAVVVSRPKGVDIHAVGNGIAGATNVKRHVGTGPAALVVVVDVAKGAAAVLVALALDAGPAGASAAGLASLVGHAWPIWTGFRGGLSAAAGVGVTAALLPVPALLAAPFAAVAVLITHAPSPGATTLYVGAMGFGLLMGADPARIVGAAVTALFVLVRARTWSR